jgi:hypothetical protein
VSAPSNLSFELPGVTPGQAAGWAITVIATAEEIADFDYADYPRSFDDWTGWAPGYLFAFTLASLDPFAFDTLGTPPHTLEDFSELWWAGDPVYHYTWSGFAIERTHESFDTGWSSNENFVFAFTIPDDAGQLETTGVDDFSIGWGVGSYLHAFTIPDDAGQLEAASFALFVTYEPFAPVRHTERIVADVANNRISAPGHEFVVNDEVVFAGAAMPPPLVPATIYFVVAISAGIWLKVSTTAGGAPVTLTAIGSGDCTVGASPDLFWPDTMNTI